MKAININCAEQDFIEDILSRRKIVETRMSRSLSSLVGQRVGLIKTGCGKAKLCGYATIKEEIQYPSYMAFREDYERHKVPVDSKYDSGRFGYLLVDVERCEEREIDAKGVVIRNI